jgi:hypothetical protein
MHAVQGRGSESERPLYPLLHSLATQNAAVELKDSSVPYKGPSDSNALAQSHSHPRYFQDSSGNPRKPFFGTSGSAHLLMI